MRNRQKQRDNVYKASNRCCIYCNKPLSKNTFTIEHYIIPKIAKICNVKANLRISCNECNHVRGKLQDFDYCSLIRAKTSINFTNTKIKLAKSLNELIWQQFYEEWEHLRSINYDVVGNLLKEPKCLHSF